MTRVISAISTKGGSGKSTTIRMLAAQLAIEGNQVVIIDTDPQNSCVRWLKNAEEKGQKIRNVGALSVDRLSDVGAMVEKLKHRNVDFVLLDVQGAATPMIMPVTKVSDLVVLPWAVTQDDWEELKSTYVIIDRIRTADPTINPTILTSINRVTATDLHHPYVKQRFEVARMMRIHAAETLIWKRSAYTNMLVKFGSIPQISSDNDSIVKAQAEHRQFAAEIKSYLSSQPGADHA